VSAANKNIKILGVCLVLAVSACGCDLISSVKEYFQGSDGDTSAKPVSVQKAAPAQVAATAMAADTLARVGTWSITIGEFNERLDALKEVVPEYDITDPEARKLVLEELINQQVLVLDAEKKGMIRQKEIDAAVEEFRRTLIVREVARQLTQDIAVSDKEALAFYNANEEAMVSPAQWHVREIVVPSKEEATELLTEILKGADFAETAQQYSIGKTASDGGDLGFIEQEPFPQMGSALLPLEEGDVSSVFRGPEGYYIVKLEEKKSGNKISFEEIKDDIIRSQVLLQQQQAVLDHLNSLKEKTEIEINEELLQK